MAAVSTRREPDGNPAPARVETVVCPRWLVRAVIGLAAMSALLLVGIVVGAVYVYQQQQFIEGRGELRDQENERLNQRINDAICDLLDQLPEGELLDRPRGKYGCGPGIALEDLPEDVRRRFDPPAAPAAPATTVPAAPTTLPPVGAPAAPNPPRPSSSTRPPAEPTTAPSPAAPTPAEPSPPAGPLDPVTDTVCQLVNVCLEAP